VINNIDEEAQKKTQALQTLFMSCDDGNSHEGKDEKILSIQNWLCQHPYEVINSIRKIQLTKYDIGIVSVIEHIGSPTADKCARQLLELLVDLNHPVYKPALSAVFTLNEEPIIKAIEDLIYDECFREVDAFCWHVIQARPDWLQKMKPYLADAIERTTYYANESNMVNLLNELESDQQG